MATRQQMADAKRRRQLEIAVCYKCKKEQPWSDFNKSPSRRPFGLASSCKSCDRARKSGQKRSRWYSQPEIEREKARCKALRRYFGITAKDYDEMFKTQQGLCAICGRPESYIHYATQKIALLAVDHCHTTGKVRALLCANCNKGLGCFADSQERLEKAITYLKEH